MDFKMQKIDELWGVIKKYYHTQDAPVKKCELKLTMPYENSYIRCEYGEEYEKADGGMQELSFENVCFLYDELIEHGITRMERTQELSFTLEEGKPVLVTQRYYV